MKFTFLPKLGREVLICLLLISTIQSFAIWDEELSRDEILKRVDSFNQWYKSINPSSKLIAKLNENNIVRSYALEEVKVIFI